jgi:hypothetical protein
LPAPLMPATRTNHGRPEVMSGCRFASCCASRA